MTKELQNATNNRSRDLVLSLLFDAVGLLSFSIPLLGEFSDVVWAPLAGFLMTWLYKGRVGKIAGIFTFLEEILPFSDVIPSFTLTWIYTYFVQKKK